MNAELKVTIDRLTALRQKIDQIEGRKMSDEVFVARYLPYSATVWSRVNSGNYRGNLETVQRRLDQAADDIEDRLENVRRRTESAGTWVTTRFAAAVLGAHRRAVDDGDGCRIVVALAPTGAGKSTIAHYLERRHGAIYVEGRQSWQASYKAFCIDVARAAGKTLKTKQMDVREAEDAVLGALGSRSGTLVIDEANTQCGAVANGIKWIVNRTNYAVVLLAIPEQWDQFAAAATNEVRQVINRCQAVLRFDAIPEADVDAFLAKSFDGDRKAACRLIADAANDFGGYKTVHRACTILHSIDGAVDADIKKTISLVRLSQDK